MKSIFLFNNFYVDIILFDKSNSMIFNKFFVNNVKELIDKLFLDKFIIYN